MNDKVIHMLEWLTRTARETGAAIGEEPPAEFQAVVDEIVRRDNEWRASAMLRKAAVAYEAVIDKAGFDKAAGDLIIEACAYARSVAVKK